MYVVNKKDNRLYKGGCLQNIIIYGIFTCMFCLFSINKRHFIINCGYNIHIEIDLFDNMFFGFIICM